MKELRLAFDLLRMNTWRVILAIVVGSLTLLSALGLAGLSAWLIARTWQKLSLIYISEPTRPY